MKGWGRVLEGGITFGSTQRAEPGDAGEAPASENSVGKWQFSLYSCWLRAVGGCWRVGGAI